MDLMEAITTRRSIRRYSDRPVEKSTLESLLNAAIEAPSASNAQPWAFVVLQNRLQLKCYSNQAKSYLLSLVPHQPRLEKYREYFTNSDFNIFHGAGTLIIIYAKPEGPTSHGDCCLAAQNLMLAAHNQGLGTCWVGMAKPLLDLEYIKASLGIPLSYDAVAPIIVGYPKGDIPHPPRKQPEIICWRE